MISVNNANAAAIPQNHQLANQVAAVAAAVANQMQPLDLFQSYISAQQNQAAIAPYLYQPLAAAAILPYGRQTQIVGFPGQHYMPISFVDPQLMASTSGNINANQAATQQLFPWQAALNLNAAAVAQAQRSNLFVHVQQPLSIVPNGFGATQLELGLHDQMARYVAARQQPHIFDGIDVASMASGSNNPNHYALNPIALFMASNPATYAPNNGLANGAAFQARRQPPNQINNQKPVYVPPNQRQQNRSGAEESAMNGSVSSMQLRSSTENEQQQMNLAQNPQQQLSGVFVPEIVGMLPYF